MVEGLLQVSRRQFQFNAFAGIFFIAPSAEPFVFFVSRMGICHRHLFSMSDDDDDDGDMGMGGAIIYRNLAAP